MKFVHFPESEAEFKLYNLERVNHLYYADEGENGAIVLVYGKELAVVRFRDKDKAKAAFERMKNMSLDMQSDVAIGSHLEGPSDSIYDYV